ncbi:sulfite exporter TauE/SafE family protein [Oceanobacillus saliphilus]|uniref:sulfite exporter TauE/SafE family protein n=1 Tax=Oceanobacillus saliphilus TaxID=2925834 RepID=UPI00201DA6B4|nr:sulfite exporter TauE/SafE family protein [Oceanobacillus saliphilus]
MVILMCLVIGVITAFVGSMMGLGGGIILVPALLFMSSISEGFAWATPQAIVGISLITMVVTALSSTLAYAKGKRVDYKTGFLFLIGSIPGGVLGSWLNQFIDSQSFLMYFGILMIGISLLFFIKRQPSSKQRFTGDERGVRTFELYGETFRYRVSIPIAFILSLLVGTLSGLFGIGGGSIMVPAMILLFGFPAHVATATSMFMIFFVSIVGASTHIALGHIAWAYVLFFIPGSWIGGRLGAKVNQMLPGKTLELALRVLLVFIGLRMIYQGLS